MTRSDFKQRIIEMFKDLEDNENVELYLHLIVYEDDVAVDLEIATTGCTICHYETLRKFIKQENIQHLSSNRQQVH